MDNDASKTSPQVPFSSPGLSTDRLHVGKGAAGRPSDDAGPVAGLVLAGGMSIRFGSDKSRWCFDGLPMRERALQQVRAVTDHVVLSVRDQVDAPAGVSYVLDRFPGKGPLAGIHAGFLDTTQEWLVVVACDMPYLRSVDLDVLVAARSDDRDAVVAQDVEGRLHPLCACYRRSTAAVIEKLLAGRERSMHRLLSRITYRTVLLPSRSLINVNSPSDLKD